MARRAQSTGPCTEHGAGFDKTTFCKDGEFRKGLAALYLNFTIWMRGDHFDPQNVALSWWALCDGGAKGLCWFPIGWPAGTADREVKMALLSLLTQ
jgi:hypothetical protein